MRTEQTVPRELEYREVRFTAVASKYDNCCCDGCFRLGKVMKLILPETKHFGRGDLTTRYEAYWLCESCIAKLQEAIRNPKPET